MILDPSSLPHLPGCYLFMDTKGLVIYVGKARDLKKRVSSYFQNKDHSPRTGSLLAAIATMDFIVTNSEVEALLLENTLIKKHWPRFNIALKDAKRYASIHLTDEPWPRICLSRKRTGPGTFFGPFTTSRERDYVLQVVRRTFGLRTCRRLPKRACLRYHMGGCSGPCIGQISPQDYRERVKRAESVLRGNTAQLLESMRLEMHACADRQMFERARDLRDEIAALEYLQERQAVERNRRYDQDVLAYLVEAEEVHLMLFKVHSGTLHGKEEFAFPFREGFLEEFLVQYYSENPVPSEIILQDRLEDPLVEFLGRMKGQKVRATVPRQGEKRVLLDLAERNVETAVYGDRMRLEALQRALSLPSIPQVIECFDISHLAGTAAVGSMVQFRGGRPDKGNYRRFRIKSVEGVDDFASLAEVVSRRYSRLIKEGRALPDLIVIDGGPGQLSSAQAALGRLGLSVPVISIAKGDEEIYWPGSLQPLPLKRTDQASLLVQHIRDEAHRFAIAYNRLLRKKNLVPG
ncbi:MAG: excinuclease ABC subunit C [Methanosaeta sp. PtaB.Bin039]|nr:MAG: excinuclease ABC subunit C [Methanosaeta sp. PtaB.Bin039]HQF16907.1 excinuclease ABC subunit UvrC [Methanotrichaceae archaeon]HQI91474.1 excinuclease ABC subunit UvrC [Methanotrichaceae archaeon]HQJ28812.1 excinuclease ABC subunit UvrC [Methanotrichaceae archaeon]